MTQWLVVHHHAVLPEFEAIRDRRARRAILRVIELLAKDGPNLRGPHSKKVRGTRSVWELRPTGGKTLFRPLYVQIGPRAFAVVAIAPEALVDPAGFVVAVARARERAAQFQIAS